MTTATLIIIFNLFILESLLSVDNAAVLAIMVKDLPGDQKNKALRYGLLGAYAFRGLCLFLASYLVKILWLKILGGLYLLYLVYGHFSPKVDTIEEQEQTPGWALKIKSYFGKKVGIFWSTIILVEIMDLAFSIDNVFAAVALSSNFWIIMAGVAIGILAMRFVAGWFVSLIQKHPSLEGSAFVVIALLGLKLIASGVIDYIPGTENIKALMENHTFDLIFSGSMMLIFFIPLLFKNKVNTVIGGLS
jgi:YkoY family integral membrane protein